MRRPDDLTLTRASGVTTHLRITGETLRDLLQDLASSTQPVQWSEAIEATFYVSDPAAHGMTQAQADARLDAALEELSNAIPFVAFALSPAQAEKLYQRLGELR